MFLVRRPKISISPHMCSHLMEADLATDRKLPPRMRAEFSFFFSFTRIRNLGTLRTIAGETGGQLSIPRIAPPLHARERERERERKNPFYSSREGVSSSRACQKRTKVSRWKERESDSRGDSRREWQVLFINCLKRVHTYSFEASKWGRNGLPVRCRVHGDLAFDHDRALVTRAVRTSSLTILGPWMYLVD